MKLTEIAAALGAEMRGDGNIEIASAAEPAAAGPDQLAIALSPRWAEGLGRGRARAALLWAEADWQALGLVGAIIAPRGRLAMARLSGVLAGDEGLGDVIHSAAMIDDAAEIGAGVGIGAFAVVGEGARIGAGVRIGAHVTIAPGAQIGPDSWLYPGVRIGARCQIGARAVLHGNVVIGADGFSFTTAEPSHLEVSRGRLSQGAVPVLDDPTWHKIHSLGGVVIGNDVEIGAGSCVDAGTIRATQIGDGVKIDNLVQVGHNVQIGAHCLLSAQSGVAGSSVIGARSVLGGKVGVADNLVIGADVVLGGGSVVLSNVPAGRVMLGYPAMPIERQVAGYKALRRLPRLLARLQGKG